MNSNENQHLAQIQFNYVCDVFHLINNYKEQIDAILTKHGSPTKVYVLGGLWYRTYYWLKTLSKPKTFDSLDFQLFATVSRTLFEIAVDMLLIYGDKTGDSAKAFENWIQSEKLNQSEKLVNFFITRKQAVPEKYSPYESFIENHETEINQQRSVNWGLNKNGKPFHPDKWNKKKLADCLQDADKILNSFSQGSFPLSLEEYYRYEYSIQSWNTHSGLNVIWGINQEDLFSLSAHFLQDCGFYSLLVMDLLVAGLEISAAIPDYETERNKIFERKQSRYSNLTKR